jgi:hypothetical protein
MAAGSMPVNRASPRVVRTLAAPPTSGERVRRVAAPVARMPRRQSPLPIQQPAEERGLESRRAQAWRRAKSRTRYGRWKIRRGRMVPRGGVNKFNEWKAGRSPLPIAHCSFSDRCPTGPHCMTHRSTSIKANGSHLREWTPRSHKRPMPRRGNRCQRLHAIGRSR